MFPPPFSGVGTRARHLCTLSGGFSRGAGPTTWIMDELIKSDYVQIAATADSYPRDWEPINCSILEAGTSVVGVIPQWLSLSGGRTTGNSGSDIIDRSSNGVSQLQGKRGRQADKGPVWFLLPRPFYLDCFRKVPLTPEVGLPISAKAIRTVLQWVSIQVTSFW